MSKYSVRISTRAQKQLDKLTDRVSEKIFEVIWKLADDPRPHGYIKLKGRDAYRIRRGNYRVIYKILDAVVLEVLVVEVGDRKGIY